jgi:hypothetical protein
MSAIAAKVTEAPGYGLVAFLFILFFCLFFFFSGDALFCEISINCERRKEEGETESEEMERGRREKREREREKRKQMGRCSGVVPSFAKSPGSSSL